MKNIRKIAALIAVIAILTAAFAFVAAEEIVEAVAEETAVEATAQEADEEEPIEEEIIEEVIEEESIEEGLEAVEAVEAEEVVEAETVEEELIEKEAAEETAVATNDAADAEPAKEVLDVEVVITCKNEKVFMGDEVTLHAEVKGATGAYILNWECDDGNGWKPLDAHDADYTWVIEKSNASYCYRATVTAQA